MTISSELSSKTWNGNDSATLFSFTFKIFSVDDIELWFTDTDGESTAVDSADYSVALIDSGAGGAEITYPASGSSLSTLATGEKLTVRRDMAFTQETDFQNNTDFLAEIIEEGLDRLTVQNQQQKEEIERAVKVSPGEEQTADELIQTLIDSAASSSADAIAADASATEAEHWANYPEDSAVPEGTGEFSSKHYAEKSLAAKDTVETIAEDFESLIGLGDIAETDLGYVQQRHLYPITDFATTKSKDEIDTIWSSSVVSDFNGGHSYTDTVSGKTYGVYFTYNFGMPPILDPRLGSHAGVEKIPTNILFDIPNMKPQGYNPSTGEWDLRVRSVNGRDNVFGVGNDWEASQGDTGAYNSNDGNRLAIVSGGEDAVKNSSNLVSLVVFGSSVTCEFTTAANRPDNIIIGVDGVDLSETDSFYATATSPLQNRYLNAGSLGKTFQLGSLGVHTIDVKISDGASASTVDLYSLRIGKDDPSNPDSVTVPSQIGIVAGEKLTIPYTQVPKKPDVRSINYDSSLDYGLEHWGKGEEVTEVFPYISSDLQTTGIAPAQALNIFDWLVTSDAKAIQLVDFKQAILDAGAHQLDNSIGSLKTDSGIWEEYSIAATVDNILSDTTTSFTEGLIYFDSVTMKLYWCIESVVGYDATKFAYRKPVNGGRTVLKMVSTGAGTGVGEIKQSTLWMPPKAQVGGVGNITVDDRANGQHRLLFGDLGEGTGTELGLATAPHNAASSPTSTISDSGHDTGDEGYHAFQQTEGNTQSASGTGNYFRDTTPSFPHYINIHFDKGYIPVIQQIRLASRHSSTVSTAAGEFATDFALEGSHDGTYTDNAGSSFILTAEVGTWADPTKTQEQFFFSFVNTEAYEYIRLRTNDTEASTAISYGGIGLYEAQKPLDMFEFQELATTRHVKEYGNGDVNGTAGRDYSALTTSQSSRTYPLDNGTDILFGTNQYYGSTYGDALTTVGADGSFINLNSMLTGVSFTRITGSGTVRGSRRTLKVGDLEIGRLEQSYYDANLPRTIQNVVGNLPYQSNVIQEYLDDLVSNSHSPIEEIHIYQPKRSPKLSKSDLIIGDWMIMADYVPATERGRNVIAKGTRRQSPDRDVWYDITGTTFSPDFNAPSTDFPTAMSIGASSTADSFDCRYPFKGIGITEYFRMNTSSQDSALRLELSEDGGENFTLLDTAGQTALGVNITWESLSGTFFDSSTGLLNLNGTANTHSRIALSGLDGEKSYVIRNSSTTANVARFVQGFDVHTSIHSSEHHLEYAEPYCNVLQQRHGVTMDSLLILDQDGNTLEDYREPWRMDGMYRGHVGFAKTNTIDETGTNIRGYAVNYGNAIQRGIVYDASTYKGIVKFGGVYRFTNYDANGANSFTSMLNKGESPRAVYSMTLETQQPHPKYKIKRRTDLI